MHRVVSVIVCTRNNAESLRQTLASISACEVPHHVHVDGVVVDNGSSDDTRSVIEQSGSPRIAFRCVREDVPGHCRARNRAMSEARGEVFLWTDDDVRVPASWITAMSLPILSGSADAVAGEVRIPPHLAEALRGTHLAPRLGLVASTHELDFSDPGTMFGANMAFSRAVLKAVPSFDANLGVGPSSLGFYDEVLFSSQLVHAGFRLVGVPGDEAAVLHHFDPRRSGFDQVMTMSRRMGRSQAHFDHVRGAPVMRWPRLALVSQNLQFASRCIRWSLRLGPKAAIEEARIRRARKVGYIRQVLASRSGP
jgi:GT2 family glycosyltransferase